MNYTQDNLFPLPPYRHIVRIELSVVTGAGALVFAIYVLVCAYLVYVSRNNTSDAAVKKHVFIFSLLTCITRTIQFSTGTVIYFKQHESLAYIHAFVTILGDACLVTSLCAVFFSWLKLLRTYFSAFPPTYTPERTSSLLVLLRVLAITNFTIACALITIFYGTANSVWEYIGDVIFNILFLVALVGMQVSGFTLKGRLHEAGCANLKSLTIVRVMSILTASGIFRFVACIVGHHYQGKPETFVFMTVLRIVTEIAILTCYIYYFGHKHLRLSRKKGLEHCLSFSSIRKSSSASTVHLNNMRVDASQLPSPV